jgi:hypothetical protein
MCSGKDCPLKENCYRVMATPSGYQSYFINPPYDYEDKDCSYHWPIKHEGLKEGTKIKPKS